MTREILSLQHPIVKHFVKLRKSRAYRQGEKSALIVGTKLVKEIAAHLPLKTLLVEKGADLLRLKAAQLFLVTPGIMKKITGVEEPEPYAAEVELPAEADLSNKNFLLALDGIADPGNLGTLLRTALALGWDGVFLCEGSADPFNEKALRAAKGATFHLPLSTGSREELAQLIKKRNMSVYVADMHGKSAQQAKIRAPLVLILGSEAHGVQFSTQDAHKIAIPMRKEMESLNVAIAGGILMYLIRSAT